MTSRFCSMWCGVFIPTRVDLSALLGIEVMKFRWRALLLWHLKTSLLRVWDNIIPLMKGYEEITLMPRIFAAFKKLSGKFGILKTSSLSCFRSISSFISDAIFLDCQKAQRKITQNLGIQGHTSETATPRTLPQIPQHLSEPEQTSACGSCLRLFLPNRALSGDSSEFQLLPEDF